MLTDASADAARCHGVLAHLVERPSERIDDAAGMPGLDLARVRAISGLIAKVRHNPMRARLPITFHALSAIGADIEFFANYAPSFTERRRAGIDEAARLDGLVDALLDWLRPDECDDHRIVHDVLTHELAILDADACDPVAPPQRDAAVSVTSRPRRRERVAVHELTVHPPDVTDADLHGAPLDGLDRTQRCYAYIPTPAGPRVKRLDPALAVVLMLADGERTVAELADLVDCAPAAGRLCDVVAVLVHGGLADIEPSCD